MVLRAPEKEGNSSVSLFYSLLPFSDSLSTYTYIRHIYVLYVVNICSCLAQCTKPRTIEIMRGSAKFA